MALDVHMTDELLEIKPAAESKELWQVLRSTSTNKQKKCVLHEKDLIKLGNFRCIVKKLHLLDSNTNDKSSSESSDDLAYRGDLSDDTDNVKNSSHNMRSVEQHFQQFKHEADSPKVKKEDNESRICRICLSEESSSSDPLINPCKCSGSMKWIHLECLRKWLINKIEIVEDDVIRIYAWKDLNCELCKGLLKSTLKFIYIYKNPLISSRFNI